jgi:hypothetical protein
MLAPCLPDHSVQVAGHHVQHGGTIVRSADGREAEIGSEIAGADRKAAQGSGPMIRRVAGEPHPWGVAPGAGLVVGSQRARTGRLTGRHGLSGSLERGLDRSGCFVHAICVDDAG